MEIKPITPTLEERESEIKEEEEHLNHKESKEEEIRAEIIKELELDEDVDATLIEKLTQKTIADRKSFGKLAGQKRKWREMVEEAQKKAGEQKPNEPENKPDKKPLSEEDITTLLDKRERDRDINNLDVSEAVRAEIRTHATAHPEKPIKDILNSPYIQFLKKQEEDKQREIDASAGSGGGTRTVTNLETIKDNPAKGLDLGTEEGQKEYARRKKALGLPA